MTCGARNEYNDVCGETYTCPSCRSGNEADRLCARIAELERVLNRTKATLEYVSGFTVNSGYIECHGDKCRQINCLSCGGEFAVSYEPNRIELSLAEITSVLGKGKP